VILIFAILSFFSFSGARGGRAPGRAPLVAPLVLRPRVYYKLETRNEVDLTILTFFRRLSLVVLSRPSINFCSILDITRSKLVLGYF